MIRKWVERRRGWPAKFLHIYFPAYVTRGAFSRVDWEEFFQAFEQRQLAFVYQERTAAGRQSYFFRLVNRPEQSSVGGATALGWRGAETLNGSLSTATDPRTTRGDAA